MSAPPPDSRRGGRPPGRGKQKVVPPPAYQSGQNTGVSSSSTSIIRQPSITQGLPSGVYAFTAISPYTKEQVESATRRRGWNKEQNDASPFWVLEKGDIGWVRKDFDQRGWTEIFLLDRTDRGLVLRPGKGYVPKQCLKIGKENTGGLGTSGGIPKLTSGTQAPFSGNNKFIRFVDGLFKNMKLQTQQLTEIGFFPQDIQFLSSDNSFRDLLHRAMERAKSSQIFSNGQPKHGQLWDLPHLKPSHNNPVPGIYCLLYVISSSNGQDSYHWYVGKSVDVYRRISDHATEIGGKHELLNSRRHYQIARKAYQSGKWCAVMLAQFNPSEIELDHSRVLRCAEQTFQCALHAINPQVLARPPSTEDFVSYGLDFIAARTVSDMTKEVAKKTDWDLDLTIGGCCWSMAMTEMPFNEKVLWLSHDVRDADGDVKMKVFCRQPMICRYRRNGQKILVVIPSGQLDPKQNRPDIRLGIPEYWPIPDKTLVNVVVEIMMNEPHKRPYSRYPRHAQFSDTGLMSRLGIRVEWQHSDGKYKAAYLQPEVLFDVPRANTHYHSHDDSPYLGGLYIRAFNLVEGLLHFKYRITSNRKLPVWKFPPKHLSVRHVEYNHMEQRLDITVPKPMEVDPPALMSPTDNHKLMYQHYGEELAIGTMPKDAFRYSSDTNRNKCDICFSLPRAAQGTWATRQTTTKEGPCKPVPFEGVMACAYCQKLRRPCTWTSSDDITAKGWEDLGILFRDANAHKVMDIVAPSITSSVEMENNLEDTNTQVDDDDDGGL